ncbi:MAG: NAD(P)/FAD-dependent oxidoreductase [Paludibaculum sp.]
MEARNFLSANPHFAKSALARFTPQNFIELLREHRIPYHEKTLEQLCLRPVRAGPAYDAADRMFSRTCGHPHVDRKSPP